MATQCLNTCCCCCSLETGGYIIGWFNIIVGFLAMIGSIIIVVDSGNQLNNPGLTPEREQELINDVIIFSIYIVYTLIYAIAGIFLVLGTKNREHRKMIMMLVLMAIGLFMSFLNLIVSLSIGNIISSTIAALIQIYFFICIYSLYAMIKNENSGK